MLSDPEFHPRVGAFGVNNSGKRGLFLDVHRWVGSALCAVRTKGSTVLKKSRT